VLDGGGPSTISALDCAHLRKALISVASASHTRSSKEISSCLGGICELYVVVFWLIEEFFEVVVASVVIFRLFHVKIGNPAQFAKHVALHRHLRVFRHSCALELVVFVGVELAAGNVRNVSLSAERLVKVLLQFGLTHNSLVKICLLCSPWPYQ